MSSINRVLLVGRLTRDPELRHTGGGTAVCQFSLAINSREKVNEEWGDRVDFFDVTVFGPQAESCAEYLGKGKLCGVDGRLRQDKWQDKETKENRYKVLVVAQNVQFLSDRDGDNDYAPAASSPSAGPDDDFPF